MSMLAHGRSRENWVCRCTKGLLSCPRPPIHILLGLKVCIQRISPAHSGSALAARHRARISSGVVSTPFETTSSGMAALPCSAALIWAAWSATSFRVSGPYRCWEPQTNHSWGCARCFMVWPLQCWPSGRRRWCSGHKACRCRPARSGPEPRAESPGRRCGPRLQS